MCYIKLKIRSSPRFQDPLTFGLFDLESFPIWPMAMKGGEETMKKAYLLLAILLVTFEAFQGAAFAESVQGKIASINLDAKTLTVSQIDAAAQSRTRERGNTAPSRNAPPSSRNINPMSRKKC